MHVLVIVGEKKIKHRVLKKHFGAPSPTSLCIYMTSGEISAAEYLLFILYIFKIYDSTLKIKGEPILYLHESYKTYSLVQKCARGLLHISNTYFMTSKLD